MAPRVRGLVPVEPMGTVGFIAPPPIRVESPIFSGTLGALFACVKESKLDLREVPLLPICAAYATYLVELKELELEEAATALAALAYLCERKAWLLLPSLEAEPEPPEPVELPEPTVGRYRPALEALREGFEQRALQFFRSGDSEVDPSLPVELQDVTLSQLSIAFESVMRRAEPEPHSIPSAPRQSLAEKMARVLDLIKSGARSLMDLLPERYTKVDAVWAFLSVLELARLGQIQVEPTEDGVALLPSESAVADGEVYLG